MIIFSNLYCSLYFVYQIKEAIRMNKVYPRTFSHIGISVPSVEKAVKFYTEVLGWYLIMEPTEVIEDDSAIGAVSYTHLTLPTSDLV